MILNFIYGMFAGMMNIYVNIASGLNGLMPIWFQEGVNSLFSGSGMMNNFLPVYAHPEMTGIVHDFGIMNVIGFLVTVSYVAIIVGIIIFVIYKVIQVLPWNTQQ